MLEIPFELQVLIAAAVTYLVTEGEKVVGGWFGKDLGGVFAGFAAAITGAVVLFFNTWLALIPPEYVPTVQAVFALLVALLAAFGIHRKLKNGKFG